MANYLDGRPPVVVDEETGLTDRQVAFMKALAGGATKHDAAVAVGYKPGHSANWGARHLQDDTLRNAFKTAAIEAGLGPGDIVTELKRGVMESEKVELSREGIPVSLGPDYHAKAKHIDMALKMMGGYPDPKRELDISAQNVLVIRADQGLAASDPFGDGQGVGEST